MRLSRTLLAISSRCVPRGRQPRRRNRLRTGRALVGARRHRADPPRHDDVHRRCPVHRATSSSPTARATSTSGTPRTAPARVRPPTPTAAAGLGPAGHQGRLHQRRQPRLRGHHRSATAPWPTAPGSPRTRSAPPTRTPAPTTTSRWSRSTPPTSPRSTRPIPFWGGPTGIDTDGTKAGDRVWTYGNSSLRAGVEPLSPHTGISLGDDAADGGWSHPLYTVTPGIPGDSGSAFMSAGGKAIGTLSTLGLAPLPASNNIGDLAKELAFAQAALRHLRPEAGERHRAVQPDPLRLFDR